MLFLLKILLKIQKPEFLPQAAGYFDDGYSQERLFWAI